MRIARLRLLLAPLTVLLAVAASDRAQRTRRLPGDQPGRYAVKIDSAPPGATIYINDKSARRSASRRGAGKLGKGDYTVIVEAPGYEPATRRSRSPRSARSQELFVPLVKKREPPKIDVRADADPNMVGATVSLDGQPQGGRRRW